MPHLEPGTQPDSQAPYLTIIMAIIIILILLASTVGIIVIISSV